MWPFDQNNRQMYEQYAQAYDTGNYNGFNPLQALGHIAQFMQGAPIETQQQLYQQHFEQMPFEQRAALAQQMPPQYRADPNDTYSLSQNFLRLGQEQPNALQRIFSHPLLMGAAVGLAGLVAKHMLSSHHHQQNAYQNQGYPNQGYQNQGFQNQGYPDQNFQNQGYQNQGYPNQGYQNQGFQQDQYYQQGQQNQYQQNQSLQQEVNELRREEEQLREEISEEERSRRHHNRRNQQSW